VALELVATFEHSLDSKGRLILPAKHRPHLSPKAYISPYYERCLALWPSEQYQQIAARMAQLEHSTPENRLFLRQWSGNVWELEPDAQGRIQIPAQLRQFAGLDSTVIVKGSLTHVELWSPEVWNSMDASGQELMASPPPGLSAILAGHVPTGPGAGS
jgi:MraZ protein